MIIAPTILFQAPNRIGLGHLNRLASIAATVQSLSPGARTPFVIEGESHFFLERFSLPFLTIPSSVELAKSPAWAGWPISEREELTARLSEAILDAWKPKLVVYDCLPNQYFSCAVRQKGIPSAFCIRQVRNFKTYAEDPKVASAISEAQVLIVPHSATTFSMPRHLLHKTVYVGDIVRPRGSAAAMSAWKTGACQRMVIVTGGGGGHARTVEFYNLVLLSLETIMKKREDLYVLLVTGPLFRDWDRLSLPVRVHVSPFEPELDDLFSRAALVISQAGYNTMLELSASGVPTICLPQPRALDDQFERAEVFSRENDNVKFCREATSGELSNMIERTLEESCTRRNSTSTRQVAGAQLAAEVLMKLVNR